MTRRAAAPTPRGLRLAAAIGLVALGGSVLAADAPSRGGLVPAPRKTREELVREWDLNSDGTIDKGEVEVASSRMRRERAELRLNSGIDPVTGLPRGEEGLLVDPGDADLAVEPATPEDEAGEEPDRDERPALPGTRVPRITVPKPGRTPIAAQASGAVQGSAAKSGGMAQSGGARQAAADGTRAAADLKRQPLTGGVKAGGLPARAGYGAGVPATPLNAGLPVVPKPRPATGPMTPARGGLVPAPRQPAASPTTTRPARSRDLYDPY